MNQRTFRGMLLFVATLGLTASAFAQNWIEPAKTPGNPVLCPPAICKNGPVWLAPYQLPLAAFTGRFLDSSGVSDNYRWPIATVRAMNIKSLPNSDRFYLHMNASVAMYKKSSFIDRLSAGETLGRATSFPSAGGTRGPDGTERILMPDAAFAAPFARSTWTIPNFDFTPQLGTIDMDDRGTVYLAYWAYGFGIIRDDNTDFTPLSQVLETGVTPTILITMKASGARYYTLISDTLNDAVLYDVTTREAPVSAGRRRLTAVVDAAKNIAQDRVAILDATGKLRFYTADSIADGSISALATFTSADGGTFRQVVTDGTNFFAVAKTPNSGTSVTVITPSGSSYVSSGRYDLTIRSRGSVAAFEPTGANYTDGFLTVAGGFGNRDMRVFRLTPGVPPAEVEMNDYLRNAYADPPAPSDGKTFVTASTAVGGGNNQLTGGAVMKIGSREFFIVGAKGIGDVYELKSSDGITLKVDGPSGTSNPRGNPTTTLFYGDPVKFTATDSNTTAQATLQWDFGNSEGTADPNVITGVAGQSVTHRYSGIAKTALTPRTVKASSVSNPSASDTKTVTFSVPGARVGILNMPASRYLFSSGGATNAPLVVGDKFYDGSDGLTEGHFSIWTIDGAEAARGRATDLVAVGGCGAHTLTMAALYGPASGAGATLATLNGADFTQTVSGITYTVRPFVADLELSASNSTTLTFSSASRFSSDLAALPSAISAALTAKWELVSSAGGVLLAGPTGAASTIGTFAVPRSALAVGSRVRLTLTSPTAFTGACAGKESSVAESALLDPPNPVIVGDCTNGAPPCSFTINSLSGVDPVAAGWTYAWSSSGSANVVPPTSTQRTWAPSFSQAGTYTLTATVTNAITSAQATKIVNVTQAGASCSPLVDGTLAVVFSGRTSGCTNGISTCTTAENIEFALSIADGTYLFGCAPHTFTWTFPDGSATGLNPTPRRLPTVGNHTVSVNVSNGTQSKTYSVVVPVGTSSQTPQPQVPTPQVPTPQVPTPQVPTPQGCGNLTPNVNMVITYANNSFSCSGISQAGCKTADKIAFYILDYDYSSACAPHTFSWVFGDGTTATGRSADHTYTTNGTYNVRCNVTVNGQTHVLTQQLVIGGTTTPNPQTPNPQTPNPQTPNPQTPNPQTPQPQTGVCPTFVPNQSMSIVFQDQNFTCTNVTQSGCSTTQTLEFYASEFGASYNSTCATHTFSWDFGDGSTASGRGASHKYASNGTYMVKCNVTVNGQTHVLTQQVVIGGGSQNPASPDVEVDFSFAANGRTYTFTPTVVKSNNAQIARWDWDFGDGTSTRVTSAQALPKSNTYASAGTFSVTLNVYDSSNRLLHTRTRQVVIAGTPTRSRAVRH